MERVDYLALRLHIKEEHPDLYLGFRNDVLNERHAQLCTARFPIGNTTKEN